jgi:hypothetical protein
MSSSYALTPTREPAEPGSGWATCGSLGAPALMLVPRGPTLPRTPRIHRLCLPCIGKGVEAATGWKVQRAWSQWLASSIQAHNNRTNRAQLEGEA